MTQLKISDFFNDTESLADHNLLYTQEFSEAPKNEETLNTETNVSFHSFRVKRSEDQSMGLFKGDSLFFSKVSGYSDSKENLSNTFTAGIPNLERVQEMDLEEEEKPKKLLFMNINLKDLPPPSQPIRTSRIEFPGKRVAGSDPKEIVSVVSKDEKMKIRRFSSGSKKTKKERFFGKEVSEGKSGFKNLDEYFRSMCVIETEDVKEKFDLFRVISLWGKGRMTWRGTCSELGSRGRR
jgi:hypothetical protein